MPTSTIDRTRERDGGRPDSTRPTREGPPPVRIRRRRISRRRSALRWLVRWLLALAVAFFLLVLWQETAHSQDESPKPPPASGEPAAKQRREYPDSIRDWVSGIVERHEKKQKSTPPPPRPAGDAPPDDPEAPAETTAAEESKPEAPRPTSRPDPVVRRGPTTPAAPPSSPRVRPGPLPALEYTVKARPLGEIPDEELPWTATLDLILSLEREFADRSPPVELGVIKREIQSRLIDLSVSVGHSDNPRENLEQLRRYLSESMGMRAVWREQPTLALLLPRHVLAERRGSPPGVGLLVLVFADLVNTYLDLEPVLAGDVLAFRYRSGEHRYTIVPTALDRLYSDRDLARLAFGDDGLGGSIRVLTRQQFWAMVIAESGAALVDEGQHARATPVVDRALRLDPKQPLPHLVRAKLLIERLDVEGARDELDIAITLAPDHLGARLERSRILAQLGDVDGVEEDLVWLFHHGKHPQSGIRLTYHYLERSRFRDAVREFAHLEHQHVSPSVREEIERLRPEVGAAPWIARLAKSPQDTDRFRAIDQLRLYPIRSAMLALVDVLEDRNLRLASYAHRALEELSGMDLPRDPEAWRAALRRERP